ncbi:MAG TPA: YkgJ family cysteine cluster protein [Nitrospiraceae bacterium]|nr:YkgJ family cysteine cluster protein [Nitrospiraceae bacterium]
MSLESTPPPAPLFEKTTHWFERAKAALLGDLPCRQGCSHCCVGLFPVTILDRQEIRRGLRSLPHEERRAIEQKAVEQAAMISASAPQLAHNRCIDRWPDRDIDNLVERYREMPCPALNPEGSCSLYAFRPLACRSMGIPPETDGVVQGACAIQTFVPLIRLSRTLREEEDRLASAEAEQLARLHHQEGTEGEELLLPYAFLPGAPD